MYRLERNKSIVVKVYIKNINLHSKIYKSKSKFILLVLIIYKLKSKLYIYVNYYALNIVIIKNRNTPLIIKKTLARLTKVEYFTIINVITTFNKIYIKEDNKYKTIFLIYYSFFKYLVILFSLYNILGIF